MRERLLQSRSAWFTLYMIPVIRGHYYNIYIMRASAKKVRAIENVERKGNIFKDKTHPIIIALLQSPCTMLSTGTVFAIVRARLVGGSVGILKVTLDGDTVSCCCCARLNALHASSGQRICRRQPE